MKKELLEDAKVKRQKDNEEKDKSAWQDFAKLMGGG